MAELTFAQAERRSYLIPGLAVLAIVAIAAALIDKFTPHRIADLAVTHTIVIPIRTVTPSPMELSRGTYPAQDDLYILTTVRIDDKLRLPIVIKDITGKLTTPDGEDSTSAIEKTEFDNLYTTFPQLKPLAGPPLYRDTVVQPNGHADGMVLLHFPIDQATWDKRTSATITITTYSQGDLTVPIPKS
jgi:hypothetical protein